MSTSQAFITLNLWSSHYLETPLSTDQLWAMDTIVMGSVAKDTTAKYIQVVIDHHSRFLWAKATKTNTATDAINTLNDVFSLVTKPERLLTDNGTNFTSNAFKRFLQQHKIAHSFTSAYHPQTNGLNEKANDAIGKGLRLARMDRPNYKWSTSLKDVVNNYNNSIHTVTGFSPEQLMHGSNLPNGVTLQDARTLAKSRSDSFKAKNKQRYDARHPNIDLLIGDHVKRRIPGNLPSNHKLTPIFEGPYRVVEKSNNQVNFTIEHVLNRNLFKVQISQLEPYILRNDVLQDTGE